MAVQNDNLNDSLSLIKSEEMLKEYLRKAKVLLDVILESGNFHQYPPEVMHDYFWIVSDYVEWAHKLIESLLNNLLQNGENEAGSKHKGGEKI